MLRPGKIKTYSEEPEMKSKIEELILDSSFDYLQPYFYSNPNALRCELGIGCTREEHMRTARERAKAIYDILFRKKADAIIFSYWMYDFSDTGEAEKALYEGVDTDEIIEKLVSREAQSLRFLSRCMMDYRHVTVRGLGTYDNPGDPGYNPGYGLTRRNRIVCYADENEFDVPALLDKQLSDRTDSEVGLVSFENECILSVYDDRGCDIVFATHEKMREFYRPLEPYFLDYDRKEMKKRYMGGK